jgi:hypothetical protein
MLHRRLLTVVFMLAVATLACSVNLGPSPTSAPPTSAPAATNTAVNFHNGGVTPEAPTESAPTEGAPTEAPTKAPTRVPTKAPTKAPKPTATEVQQSTCAGFQANGDVYWLTFDANNNSTKVDSYPDGATVINPAFDYDCNPKAVQLVTIWSLDGKQIFTAKHTVDPSDTASTYVDGLQQQDNSALPNGTFGVQFLNGKTTVASGQVVVGSGGNGGNGGNGGGGTVTIEGTITDKASGKPIPGAGFVVLNPGITADQWVNTDNGADADVYSTATADSKGQFTVPKPLERGQSYSLLAGAKGYKLVFKDGYAVTAATSDPDVWDIQLSK